MNGKTDILPVDVKVKNDCMRNGFCPLKIGEELRINGGEFTVASWGKEFVQLRILPGTKVTKQKDLKMLEEIEREMREEQKDVVQV